MVPSLGSFIELRAANAGMSRRWVEVLDEHERPSARPKNWAAAQRHALRSATSSAERVGGAGDLGSRNHLKEAAP